MYAGALTRRFSQEYAHLQDALLGRGGGRGSGSEEGEGAGARGDLLGRPDAAAPGASVVGDKTEGIKHTDM